MLRCNIVIKNFLLDVNIIHVYVLYTIIHYVAMYEYSNLNKILLEEKTFYYFGLGQEVKTPLILRRSYVYVYGVVQVVYKVPIHFQRNFLHA